jgi:hypothetical protein
VSQAIPHDSRLEVKFIGDELEYQRLRAWIRIHSSGFHQPYSPRRINNVYFDPHNYTSLETSLNGSSERWKVRYRWYGHSPLPSSGKLEIKCKRNVYGWKLSFPVDLTIGPTQAQWNHTIHKLTAQLEPAAQLWLHRAPRPLLINRYHREYFATGDEHVRLTLDTDESVYDQRYGATINVDRPANIPRLIIVEVKCSREHRQQASDIIQSLPLRVSRHSKFVKGVLANRL